MRQRFFTPVNLFVALAGLIAGTNNEGYLFSLRKLSKFFNIVAPTKSALSQYRKKISYLFFKNIFDEIAKNFKSDMKTYKGYHVVGFDGDDLNLPPTEDILKNDYQGYKIDNEHETHYLKMYLVKCIDLLSNVVLDFKQAAKNDEIGLAIEMLSDLPKRTIALYDRLYFSSRMISAHIKNEIFFLARCKSGSTFKEVVEFYRSSKRRSFFYYYSKESESIIKINLIKIKNPKTKESIVIATNIDVSEWTNKEITNLYTLRWDCETNNRDSTSTLKLDQWHSKFFNGIMQEIYVHLIMMNISKITIFQEGGYEIDLEKDETRKANFKFIFYVIFDLIPDIIKNKTKSVIEELKKEIKKTIEKRTRLSRSYPRQLKKRAKSYANASLVKIRSLN